MTLSLQEMSDRFELQDLCYQYADIVDRCGKQPCAEELRQVFTEDAQIDYRGTGGIAGSLNEIIPFLNDSLVLFPQHQHLNANIQLVITGDTATGRVMCFNPMAMDLGEGNTHTMLLALWYQHKYVRTSKGWLISELSQENSWSYNVPEAMKAMLADA